MASPLRLHYIDLLSEARQGRSRKIIGREAELRQLLRTLGRRGKNNLLVAGPPGVGKTSLIEGAAAAFLQDGSPTLRTIPMIRLETAQLAAILRQAPKLSLLGRIRNALASLPPAVVVIDEFGALLNERIADPWDLEEIFAPFFHRRTLRLLGTLTEEEYRATVQGRSRLEKQFDVLHLIEPSTNVCEQILAAAAPRLATRYRLTISPAVLVRAVDLARQLPSGRALPDRALELADEACALCAQSGKPMLREADLRAVVSERSGIPPLGSLRDASGTLRRLDQTLRAAIRGQDQAVSAVAEKVRNGWLGLRNPSRPIGTFLFLGPSGVGKTECAKVVSREVYGSESALVRIDCTEFQEPHTVQRLLGAPPGYVGHETGGQLTNPIAARAFSLILFDELEKADQAVYDTLLHLLDDGRLTDGRGHTVDFTKTIIIATSNLGSLLISEACARGVDVSEPDFLRAKVLPLLLRRFRPEFLNRFDAIVVFRTLSPAVLADIAALELRKLEARFKHLHVQFRVSSEVLKAKVAELADPRFGARPLKRFLETVCERLAAETLLARPTEGRVHSAPPAHATSS